MCYLHHAREPDIRCLWEPGQHIWVLHSIVTLREKVGHPNRPSVTHTHRKHTCLWRMFCCFGSIQADSADPKPFQTKIPASQSCILHPHSTEGFWTPWPDKLYKPQQKNWSQAADTKSAFSLFRARSQALQQVNHSGTFKTNLKPILGGVNDTRPVIIPPKWCCSDYIPHSGGFFRCGAPDHFKREQSIWL